jgi:hypothetical protein
LIIDRRLLGSPAGTGLAAAPPPPTSAPGAIAGTRTARTGAVADVVGPAAIPIAVASAVSVAAEVAAAAAVPMAAAKRRPMPAAAHAVVPAVVPRLALPKRVGPAHVALMHREFRNGSRRRFVALDFRERGSNEPAVPGPQFVARVVALRFGRFGGGFRLARLVAMAGGNRHGCVGRRRHDVAVGPARAMRVDQHAEGLVFLARPRLVTGLEDVLGLAGRTSSLSNCGTDQSDNYVICNASFAWTIVIHVVANTQRALLHSLPQKQNHFFNRACRAPGAGICRIGRVQSKSRT